MKAACKLCATALAQHGHIIDAEIPLLSWMASCVPGTFMNPLHGGGAAL
jgi:hypothetical protein